MRSFIEFMRLTGVLRYRVSGLEHVKPGDNYLILANHPSLIDVVFLLAWFPQAVCVVKQAIFENTFTRHVVSLAEYISNHDPSIMLTESVARLNKGRSLILFPEGTRTTPGQPLVFQQAASVIAFRSDTQCLPVLIRVKPTTLTKENRWYQIPQQQVFFRMTIEQPLRPTDLMTDIAAVRRPDRQFNRYLHDYFSARLAQKPS